MTERWTDKKPGFTGGVPPGLGALSMKRYLKEQGGLFVTKMSHVEPDGSVAIIKGHGMYVKTIWEPKAAAVVQSRIGTPWVCGEDLNGCLGLGGDCQVSTYTLPDTHFYYTVLNTEELFWPRAYEGDPSAVPASVSVDKNGPVGGLFGTPINWAWLGENTIIYDKIGYQENYLYINEYGTFTEPVPIPHPEPEGYWPPHSIELHHCYDGVGEVGYLYNLRESSMPPDIFEGEYVYAGYEVIEYSWESPPRYRKRYRYVHTEIGGTAERADWQKINSYVVLGGFPLCKWAHTKGGTSLLITADGAMYCCGGNEYGQLGIGKEMGSTVFHNINLPNFWTNTFLPVPGGPWKMAGGGERYKWALHQDGTLWVTGSEGGGINLGGTDSINTFTQANPDQIWYGIIPESKTAIKEVGSEWHVYRWVDYILTLMGRILKTTLAENSSFTMLELIAAEQGTSNNPTTDIFSQWFE